MTGRLIAGVACVLGFAAAGQAQFVPGANGGPTLPQYPYPNNPFANPQNFAPNYYNRTTQPLSPYLNLLRGGNAGVNYYYGVRPGTVGGGAGLGGGAPFTSPGAVRQPFFSQNQLPAFNEPLDPANPAEGYTLPPAGHPVVFNNTLGYFPGGGGAGRGGRPALGGVGNTRPAGGSSAPRNR